MKDFDNRNDLKKKINEIEEPIYANERDIRFAHL